MYRKIISTLIILLITPVLVAPLVLAKESGITATIGHKVLELEKTHGVSSNYIVAVQELNEILDDANFIPKKDPDLLRNAMHVFRTIGEILDRRGYKLPAFGPVDLLHDGLNNKIIDCDMLSIIYVSIAQRRGFPIYAISCPGHMLVGWKSKYFGLSFWESTISDQADKAISRNEIIERYNISKASLRKKVYLYPMTEQQLLACSLLSIGTINIERGNYEEARRLLQESLRLYPNNPGTLNNLAILCKKTNDIGRSIKYLKIAEYYDPSSCEIQQNLFLCYKGLKSYNIALSHITKAIGAADFFNKRKLLKERAEIYFHLGRGKEALKDLNEYEIMSKIDPDWSVIIKLLENLKNK